MAMDMLSLSPPASSLSSRFLMPVPMASLKRSNLDLLLFLAYSFLGSSSLILSSIF